MPLPPPPSNHNGHSPRQRGRTRAAAAGGQRQPMPSDVTLMNVVASSVFALAAAGAVVALVLWLMRSPMFPISAIQLDGDLSRNSLATVRANAAPLLAGNFFSVDLRQGQAAFETVPWVRHAVVRRVWPGTLAVRLEEHRAAALWETTSDGVGSATGGATGTATGGATSSAAGGGGDKLVNTFGEVFDANIGDVEDDPLPRLAGPEGTSAQVLAVYRRLQPAFETMDMVIDRLVLSNRGSWRAELDSGAVVELGRGTDAEVVARSERFVRTLAQVTARWKQPLASADLRHTDGYALRLRGVGTTPTAPGATKPN